MLGSAKALKGFRSHRGLKGHKRLHIEAMFGGFEGPCSHPCCHTTTAIAGCLSGLLLHCPLLNLYNIMHGHSLASFSASAGHAAGALTALESLLNHPGRVLQPARGSLDQQHVIDTLPRAN